MKEKIVLILIFLLGFILRFYRYPEFPSGFNLDEVSQGYTAYSILKTGRDEWNEFLPIAPRSFGDYRSPLYTYLIIPSISVLGLTKFAVRLPAAIFGSLSVVTLYLLVKELVKNGLAFDKEKTSTALLPLASSFLLAVSPWSISLSRGAFEASLNAFFITSGMYLFLRGMKKWPYYLGAGILLGLNIFTYYSPRFFTPLAVLIMILFFKRSFFGSRKYGLFVGIFSFFLLLSFYTFFAGSKTRVVDTSIINSSDNWRGVADRQYESAWFRLPLFFSKVFNNKVMSITTQFYKQYLNYFSFHFLFSQGASEATYGMIPGRGVLFLFEMPLILISLYGIIKSKNKYWRLILILLLLSPVPAALAKGERAGNRAVTMLPFWQILSAGGLLYLWGLLKGKISFKIYYSVFLVVLVGSLTFFLEDYFYHAPRDNAPNMAYGWEEVADYVNRYQGGAKTFIVSKELSEPQIAIAFYFKMDPKDVQKESVNWLLYEQKGLKFVDQLPEYKLGMFEFRKFHFPDDKKLKNSLFIGKDQDFWGEDGEVLKIVYYPGPGRKIAFKIVSFDNEKN